MNKKSNHIHSNRLYNRECTDALDIITTHMAAIIYEYPNLCETWKDLDDYLKNLENIIEDYKNDPRTGQSYFSRLWIETSCPHIKELCLCIVENRQEDLAV